ncbi:MAG TPA: type II secretion system F family protein [Candidatus Paceibacterota bacterium]|jgi:type IV pilus assembly protein PilC
MKFSVVVRGSDGAESTQIIEAPTRFAVYSEVEKGGATVVSLEEKGAQLALPAWANMTFGSGVKTEQRITLTKNLSAMLAAGLTLSRALSVIARQTANKTLKKIVNDLELGVKSGASFHEALGKHPKVFSRLFVAMTKAGEEGGKLAETLKVVARQMETAHQLTKKIKGAMIYPSIILGAIVIIGVLMLIYVVPTLSSTFVSLGVDLPRSTQIIVGASDFAVDNVVVVFGLLLLLVAGGYFFFRSKFGSRMVLGASLHMPVIKDLVRETYSARAARTLSSLLSSGVEMLTAIGITAEVVGENRFGTVLKEAEARVKKGEALSATFNDYPKLYPVFVSEMISVGEETGKLADMLGQVAEYYEQDVEARTKDLSTIIEPILMLFIGVFVGIFALSMIAPIYSLSDKI